MPKRISLDSTKGWSYVVDDRLTTVEGLAVELGEWKGRGGNSAVYSCQDAVSGDELAIKFLLVNGKKMAQRFARETALLSDLDNVHVIKYRGSGSTRARVAAKGGNQANIQVPFIVMEMADRNLFEEITERKRAFPYEEYAGQFRGLAGALALLHTKAIHRDIKPENILISGERWLLSDYGLCSAIDPALPDLTGQDPKIGPKYWLSPEAQNRMLGNADSITRASDVYQLAAVFWFAATGRHPTGVVTENDWTGPPRLFSVLHSALMHNSTSRPQDGAAFQRAIIDGLEAE
jgi:serine/threonine protein kinase